MQVVSGCNSSAATSLDYYGDGRAEKQGKSDKQEVTRDKRVKTTVGQAPSYGPLFILCVLASLRETTRFFFAWFAYFAVIKQFSEDGFPLSQE
jgi:hypothetical protein